MVCFYNNPLYHRVMSNGTTVGATVALAVTNDTNIPNEQEFHFRASSRAVDLSSVAGAPVPVTIGINGTQIPLWNKFGTQILSDQIPRSADGYAVTEGTTPHVILLNTPITNKFIWQQN